MVPSTGRGDVAPHWMRGCMVFCIFDFHIIGDLLYSMTMPDVDLLDEVLPQSASAYPDNRSINIVPLR